MRLLLDHRATEVDVAEQLVHYATLDEQDGRLPYDQLVIATGAAPQRPPITGLDRLGPADGVHVLHSMGDAFEVQTSTAVRGAERVDGRLRADGEHSEHWTCDLLLVVTGVKPDSDLAAKAGVRVGIRDAIAVDQRMRTSVPDVWGAGDCAETYHRLGP